MQASRHFAPRRLLHRGRAAVERCRAWYRRLPEPVRKTAGWLRSTEFVVTSSSLAFYAMVSLPPMVLIALWITGGFVDDAALRDLGQQVDSRAPEQLPVAAVLRELIDVAARTGPLAVLAAIWPATTYGAALARAFSAIAPGQQRRMRSWRGRLLALAVIAALPLVVFSGLAGLYVLPRLLGSGWPLRLALAAGALVALAAVTAFVYWLFELYDSRWHDLLLGAGTATALVATSTAGYLVYLEVADLTARYGATALATAVLLGLWLLLGNAALLVGYRLVQRRARARCSGGAGPTPPVADGAGRGPQAATARRSSSSASTAAAASATRRSFSPDGQCAQALRATPSAM
jgi:uncharacterized BrkB/YihY/UPF0761 family membrane protein